MALGNVIIMKSFQSLGFLKVFDGIAIQGRLEVCSHGISLLLMTNRLKSSFKHLFSIFQIHNSPFQISDKLKFFFFQI
jgi:hypothetical protein